MTKFEKNYSRTLAGEDAVQFKKKIDLCCGHDPYEMCVKDFVAYDTDPAIFPSVSREDLIGYLVSGTNFLTLQQMKAYKSLEGHNYVTSGHIDYVKGKVLPNNRVLVIGQVSHSQSLSSPSLKPWVLLMETGEVSTGHCTCMAGLGSACSHVSALLFFLEIKTTRKNSTTCTSRENGWLPPREKSDVLICEIKDCNLDSANKKYKILCGEVAPVEPTTSRKRPLEELGSTDQDFAVFLSDLNNTDPTSALLDCVEPFASERMTSVSSESPNSTILPEPLTNIYDPSTASLPKSELFEKCEKVFKSLKITDDQCAALEEATRAQSNSHLWMVHRAGRLTASKMHSICHTSLEDPSPSLVRSICRPSESQFITEFTERGKVLDKPILDAFEKVMKNKHEYFELKNGGLYLNEKFPFLGASPDGLVTCLCHGVALVEVKTDNKMTDKENICGTVDGKLPCTHSYYYQIQTQMLITGIPVCYLVGLKTGTGRSVVDIIRTDKPLQEKMLNISEKFLNV